MERLSLYVDANFLSPYAMSAYAALREKGLSFELCRIDLAAREQHAPHYAGISLTHRVPTLVHDDFCLSESSAIAEYMDECFPPPTYKALYPHDPALRGRAREIQAWLRSDLAPLRQERPTEVLFRGETRGALSEAAQIAAAKLFAVGERLLQGDAAHLLGEWSIADIDYAVMLNRLLLNGDEVPLRLADYARRQWQRGAVQDWLELGRRT